MSRLHGTKDFWLGALRADGPAFRAAVAEAPPDAPVPSCPDWTTTDLVHHLGSRYRWVRGVVTGGGVEAPSQPPVEDGLPSGTAGLEWWQHEYDQLPHRVRRARPGDAGLELGAAAEEGRVLAAPDGPRDHGAPVGRPVGDRLGRADRGEARRRRGERGAGHLVAGGPAALPEPRYGVVQLVAVDAGQDWYLRLRGTGVALLDTDTILDSDDHHARAHVTGNASDLLLALWGRINFDVLEVSGDVTLLQGLRAG